ncbi:MAG: hypothetical protein IJ751_08990, partial [Oscillospiraceae bacterium]|nr:hypothetical protein [Oscillospiraceae bacterium]
PAVDVFHPGDQRKKRIGVGQNERLLSICPKGYRLFYHTIFRLQSLSSPSLKYFAQFLTEGGFQSIMNQNMII